MVGEGGGGGGGGGGGSKYYGHYKMTPPPNCRIQDVTSLALFVHLSFVLYHIRYLVGYLVIYYNI